MKPETRAVEIRLSEDPTRSGPGLIEGVLIRYGEVASDRPERFQDGALQWPEGGVVLRAQHDRAQPIMRFTPTVEGREVRISAALPDTTRGRDSAVMIRNGTYRGLSLEFYARAETRENGLRVVTKATLDGVGLVDDPSYKGSAVSVRHKAGDHVDHDEHLMRLL